jgi:hypothetical protein
VGVALGSGVFVTVGVRVGTGVSVGGGVCVGVLVGLGVAEGLGVRLGLWVGVKVGLRVRLGVEVTLASCCGSNCENEQARIAQARMSRAKMIKRVFINPHCISKIRSIISSYRAFGKSAWQEHGRCQRGEVDRPSYVGYNHPVLEMAPLPVRNSRLGSSCMPAGPMLGQS